MRLEQKLCGYTLGRFVSSRQSFLARPQEKGAGGAVFLQVVPRGASVHGDDDVLDVGRAPNGDLVVLTERSIPSSIDAADDQTVPGRDLGWPCTGNGNPVFFERDDTIEENEKDAPTPRVPSAISSFATRVMSLTSSLVGRRRRLVTVFVVVGFGLVTVLLVGIGSNDVQENAPLNGGSSQISGDMGTMGLEKVIDDPLAFAIAEVHAGRVASLLGTRTGATSNAAEPVVGRIVSRNGDFVLVEVSATVAGERTIATLLLQRQENGWRTRDVFDPAG